MKRTVTLKRLEDQVIVITGASSGIGLVTARMAAKRGARLVLNARNEEILCRIATELDGSGANVIYVTGDVGVVADVRRVAQRAVEHFGEFDTWINNAGVSIYGQVLDQALADQRRLFDTNYWGVVHGSLVACEELRKHGGALINVGSALSDRAIPLQGTYSASKHAVKGYTDALRVELEGEQAPISVTLIKPSSIDTPYIEHAKNLLPVEPQNPPPVYAPETVATAILHCAEHAEREVFVGAAGMMLSEVAHHAPRLTDRMMESLLSLQRTDRVNTKREDSLYSSTVDGKERNGYPGHVFERSLYTKAALHRNSTRVLLAGTGIGLAAWWFMLLLKKGARLRG